MKIKFLVRFICLFFFVGYEIYAGKPVHAKEEYIVQQIFKLGKRDVYDAIFSPDNRYIITLSGTHKLELWNSRTGDPVKAFPTGKHRAISLIYHPKNPLVISGGKDHTIHLWDTNRGENTHVLRGHIGNVNTLAIDAQGNFLASGSDDGAILIWDLQNLKLKSTIQKAHQGAVHSVDFHPNGKMIASGGKDRKIRLWNSETGKMLSEFDEHAGEVVKVTFHANGRLLASGSRDKTIKVWNLEDRVAEHTFSGHKDVLSGLDFHPNGSWLISGGADGMLQVWDIKSGKKISDLKSVAGPVISVHLDSTGKWIVAAIAKGITQSWKLGPSSYLTSLKGHKNDITTLDFTKNGKYLISSALDKTVQIWDIAAQKSIASYPTENHRVQDLRINHNSLHFATAGADSVIGLWETRTGKRVASLESHRGKVNSIDFHPTDPVLLSGGTDQKWVLWDLEREQVIKVNSSYKDEVSIVRFSPDGKLFATGRGNTDRSVQVWTYPEGKLVHILKGHQQKIRDLDFSPIAPLLATASDDETVKIWDISPQGEGKLKNNLKGHSFLVSGISYSKDGKTLISASRDKTARLWDVKTGHLIRILTGESDGLSALAVRPDGRMIALGTLGEEIVLLDYPLSLAEIEDVPADSDLTGTDNGSTPPSTIQGSQFSEESLAAAFVEDQSDVKEIVEEIIDEQIYKIPETEDKKKIRDTLQKTLNALLIKEEVCEQVNELEKTALGVIRLAPNDLAAYHALLKVAATSQDLNMIFMLTKIAGWANFQTGIYKYAKPIDVRNNFDYWSDQVFDQAQIRQKDSLFLSFTTCNGRVSRINVPEPLLYLDIPNEYLEKAASIPHFIDLEDFQELDAEEFKNRLLNQIQERLETATPFPDNRVSMTPDIQSPRLSTGQFFLNMEGVQLWGNPRKLLFQLRERNHPWQSYFTASDKKKTLTLPAGQYYLKIGKSIRRAFILNPDQDIVIEGPDLQ
ncbi:MAG: hypothetical protein HQM13_20830 [SAR324 cluster bacterium]|nr:hypothetical protein [SAR324 cluster bacterium]